MNGGRIFALKDEARETDPFFEFSASSLFDPVEVAFRKLRMSGESFRHWELVSGSRFPKFVGRDGFKIGHDFLIPIVPFPIRIGSGSFISKMLQEVVEIVERREFPEAL